jgi:hypothetical protein
MYNDVDRDGMRAACVGDGWIVYLGAGGFGRLHSGLGVEETIGGERGAPGVLEEPGMLGEPGGPGVLGMLVNDRQ